MKYFFLLFICALLVSCFNEGDCLITATNFVRVQFKKKKNNAQDTVVTFAYRSVEIQGQTVVLSYPAGSQILLPLNLDQDSISTTFILHRIKATDSTNIYATDTIRIGYTKQTKIISKDCGAYTYYQNLSILKHTTTGDTIGIKAFSKSLLKDPTGAANAYTSYALNFQIFY
jgi:hypothetical protein